LIIALRAWQLDAFPNRPMQASGGLSVETCVFASMCEARCGTSTAWKLLTLVPCSRCGTNSSRCT
jgi:hypothetical protein